MTPKEHIEAIHGVDLILEIGCHQMTDTVWLRRTFPKARIVCFDPDPRNVEYVRSHRLPSRLRVEFHPVALGDVDGNVEFWLSSTYPKPGQRDWTRSGSLRKPKSLLGESDPNWLKFVPEPVTVECRRLDGYGLTNPDLIWMDAQAAEDMIISGGRETFAQTRYLFTEHNCCGCYHDEPGLPKILTKLGPSWGVVEAYPYDVFLRRV